MTSRDWSWKNKDGSAAGLLYESGNWGDLLKMQWIGAIIDWKQRQSARVNYFDPFAGDVRYPLGKKTAHRLAVSRPEGLDFIREPYVQKGEWPSAASGAMLLAKGTIEVWDADPGRRERWARTPGATLLDGDSGWQLLELQQPDSNAVWLLDPYDFLAEWRECLELVVEKSRTTSIIIYLYNRSAKSREFFAEYRAFRNALEDMRGDLPLRLGRVAADAFLPQSHHEMLFLPSETDCRKAGMPALFEELERRSCGLAQGLERCAAYDC